MTTLRAIILAAGRGRRMGSSKALLDIDGTTLVEHHVERLLEVGCSSIVVVVRPDAAPAVNALVREHPEVHVEAVATSSQGESLAAGLRVLEGSQGDVLIVTPVDMLPAEATTHAALLASLTGAALAATPVYRDHGGHPVVAYRSVFAAYEAADTESGAEPGSADDGGAARSSTSPHPPLPSLRDVLAEAGDDRRRVEVDDENVLGDLDTPADVQALASRRRGDDRSVAGAGRR